MIPIASANRSTQFSETLTAPTGSWARIVLNYTGSGVNTIFDSSFRGFVDRSMVLFGTTPEYGQWTVLQDLTEYSALLRGSFNFTFLVDAAVGLGGYFLTTLSLSFYPVPAGQTPPSEPMSIIPLWYRVSPSSTSPTVYVDTTLPMNVTNATLELYAYGLNADEFWYAAQPGLREIQVFSNGTQFLSILPFQYINTGGISLFTWRPIAGAFTLADRPYRLNVTAGLGLLEGTHNLTARISGLSAGSVWYIGGSLLMDTSASMGPATVTSSSVTSPAPAITTDGTTYYDETTTVSLHLGSTLASSAGPVNVSSWTNETYSRASTLNRPWLNANWTNLSSDQRSTMTSLTEGPGGTAREVQTYDFPVAMDQGDAFVVTSTTGGTYPIYGNYTKYFDNVLQEWNETLQSIGSNPLTTHFQRVDDRVTCGVNINAGTEELTGPNSGLDLSNTLIEAQTTKFYSQYSASPSGGTSYSHLVIGSSYQPTTASLAETILTNLVSAPVTAAVIGNVSTIDVGRSVHFTAAASGGGGPFSYSWGGLPGGCVPVDSPVLSCTPSGPGTFFVTVVVSDALGGLSPTATTALVVNPSPTATVQTNLTLVDVGQTLLVTATAVGGTGALQCRWSVSGGAWSTLMLCSSGYSYTPRTPGALHFSVQVIDAIGYSFTSLAGGNVTVAALPSVVIVAPSSNATTVGTPLALTAYATGGAGTLLYEWLLDATPVDGVQGPLFTFVPTSAGSYLVTVEVTDGAGMVSESSNLTIEVGPAPAGPSGGNGGGSSSLPGGLDWYAFLALGIVFGLLGGVVMGVLLGGRRPPRSSRPPPRSAARRPPPSGPKP